MKILSKTIIIILVIALFQLPHPVFAANRVICKVEVLSEESASIQLRWLDPANKTPIRIIGWSVEDNNTLKITYITGANVVTGWDTKKVEGSDYHFPMKVFLEEQNVDGVSFSDMPSKTEEKESILNLYHRGILAGYSDGTFKPNGYVTRAEFAKMVSIAANYVLLTNQTEKFKDVNMKHWAFNEIMTLAEKGILKGRNTGNFDPSGKVTIGEAIAVLNRTFMVVEHENTFTDTLIPHWTNEDFISLVEVGIVKSTDIYYKPYTPSKNATREQCAVLISRMLEEVYDLKVE